MRLVTPKTFQTAWFFTILPCIFILGFDLAVLAQYPQTLVPLHSTRADVERIAKLTSTSGDEVEFETDEEVLDIKFASSPCDRNGWNVPKATVISYRSTPKEYLQIQTYKKSDSTIIHGTDSGRQIISFIKRGMHVTTTADLEHVDHVLFTPRPEDASFRCAGFPIYTSLSDAIYPQQTIQTTNIRRFDANSLVPTVAFLRGPIFQMRIFVYCPNGSPGRCDALQKRENIVRRWLSPSENSRLHIQIGGYRDESEIVIYNLQLAVTQFEPTPYFRSPWFDSKK